MKKSLFLLFLFIFVLSACQSRSESYTGSSEPVLSAIDLIDSTASGTVPYNAAGSVEFDDLSGSVKFTDDSSPVDIGAANISHIRIKDVSTMCENEITTQNMINEFCALIDNQKLTKIEKLSGEAYKVELADRSGNVLTAIFNHNTVNFDRDIIVGDTVLSKGAYENIDWSWKSFSFYLRHFIENRVVDPTNIQYPATISIQATLDDIFKLELADRGIERVNAYEVYPLLYDFINNSFTDNSFEIIRSKKYYDYDELQSEVDRTKKESRCVLLTFSSSDTLLPINSSSSYDEFVMTYSITIARNPQPGIYKLITDKIVFDIKVSSKFDEGFISLFDENEKADEHVTPNEIKALFDSKKPYYMEYICKNLGIEEWSGRPPDRLEINHMKLNPESRPYTVVSIYDTFSLRMLVFKQNIIDGSLSFVGDMDFRNWPDSSEYGLEKAGDLIWITGKRNMGHGTGVSQTSQQWYMVTDTEVKPVLLFSFDDYSVGPYGGYTVKAKKGSLNKTDSVKIAVEYDTSKIYNLYLDIADEYGAVELKGSKTVDFVWNEQQQKFISENEVNENGAFTIFADTPEITKKCDELLKEHYIELGRVISAIPKEENEHGITWRAESIKAFLNDCTDCPEKTELLKKIGDIFPEDSRKEY